MQCVPSVRVGLMPGPSFLRGETAEIRIAAHPDRLIMIIPGMKGNQAHRIANNAVRRARQLCPKLTGNAARRLYPLYGAGYVGIGFPDHFLWYQEQGAHGFTMWSLQGKVIPMWVDDPAGLEAARQKHPRTRILPTGRQQTLIFRTASKVGRPGRISARTGGGKIATGNVGIKWRHPGLAPRLFMNRSLTQAVQEAGILPVRIYAADISWRNAYGQMLLGQAVPA
jgi:hypothetical protein